MNFCENCNVVTQDKYCPLCGGKKLRPVKSDDFCLITEAATSYSQTLMAAFDEEEIPYSALPYGSGVEAQFGIPLKNYRLFVPYSHYEEAIRIVRDIVNAETEKLRKNLIDGIGGLNISPKLEKKLMKKLRLYADADFFEYCVNIVETAKTIEEVLPSGGRLPSGGHYIFCYADLATLTIDSATFEVLSLTINK